MSRGAPGSRVPALAWVLGMSVVPLAMLASPALGDNQALVTGGYGGSLGAGAATGAERSAFGQNPAALRPGRFGAHAHFHRPFGMDELQVAEAGVFADRGRFGAAFDWRETGVDGLYGEQAVRSSQALRLGRVAAAFPGVLDMGVSWERGRSTWPGGATTTAWSHGFGAAWRMLPRLKAGAFISGLPLDPTGEDVRTIQRVVQFGLEAGNRDPVETHTATTTASGQNHPGAFQILRLDFRKTGDTPWRVLASLSFSPHPSVELTGGLANPPFQASLGIRFAWRGAEWDQAIRHHRYLGRTWLSGVAYSRLFDSQ